MAHTWFIHTQCTVVSWRLRLFSRIPWFNQFIKYSSVSMVKEDFKNFYLCRILRFHISATGCSVVLTHIHILL